MCIYTYMCVYVCVCACVYVYIHTFKYINTIEQCLSLQKQMPENHLGGEFRSLTAFANIDGIVWSWGPSRIQLWRTASESGERDACRLRYSGGVVQRERRTPGDLPRNASEEETDRKRRKNPYPSLKSTNQLKITTDQVGRWINSLGEEQGVSDKKERDDNTFTSWQKSTFERKSITWSLMKHISGVRREGFVPFFLSFSIQKKV